MKSGKRIRFAISGVIVAILIMAAVSLHVFADSVTDTIAVRVGYTGMELSDYAEVANYHWSELANNLPIYDQAYSYFQGKGNGNPEFTEIVDSARGFYLTDFLDYANIYYGDIYNLKFYVVDHQGIQAAFDRDELFRSRYYFEDYNGHIERTYNDNFDVVSVNSDECWNYCKEVEPMLALEDNWVSFSQEFEHAYPDFEHASTSSRFRLLFGQTYPEESLTSSSAKYVSCVYVTLRGKPEFGEMPELDGSYGSHTVKLDVSVNAEIRDVVSEFIKMNSTNEDVLVIRNVTTEADSFYSDVSHIVIDYDIVGEGTASITASYGSGGTEIASSPVVNGSSANEEADGNNDEKSAEKDADNNKDSGKEDSLDGSGSKQGRSGSSSQSSTIDKNTKSINTNSDKKTAEVTSNNAKSVKRDNSDSSNSNSTQTGTFRFSDELQEKISASNTVMQYTEASEDITEVVIQDATEEEQHETHMIFLMTCFGSTLIASLGGVWENLSFRRRMKKFK